MVPHEVADGGFGIPAYGVFPGVGNLAGCSWQHLAARREFPPVFGDVFQDRLLAKKGLIRRSLMVKVRRP